MLGPDGVPLEHGRTVRLFPPHVRRAAEAARSTLAAPREYRPVRSRLRLSIEEPGTLVAEATPAPDRDPRLAGMINRIGSDGLSYRSFGTAEELANNEDVKEFYLGGHGAERKSFRGLKSYKRRKRWL